MVLIEWPLLLPVASGGYHSLGTDSCYHLQDLITVISFIGSDSLSRAIGGQDLEKCRGLRAVVSLTAGQNPTGQLAESLDEGVNLGRKPPA